jgi:hypothetical protein
MKNPFFTFLLIIISFKSFAQNQFFYTESDVLMFLNENSFSNNSTEIKFSQNGGFLNIKNNLFNNPSIKIISNTTALVKYFSISNPSISASIRVEKNGEYIIDRSSNIRYDKNSVFDKLEKIRKGKYYNETREDESNRLYNEKIENEKLQKVDKITSVINKARNEYSPDGEKLDQEKIYDNRNDNIKFENKKKYTDMIGNKVGLNVFQIESRFIEIGKPFPDTISYQNANVICKNAGNGWRLPTKKEMQYIIENSSSNPIEYRKSRYKINGQYDGLSLAEQNIYWTSTKESAFTWSLSNNEPNKYDNRYAYLWKADNKIYKRISFFPVRDVKLKSLKELNDYYFIGKPLLVSGKELIQFDLKNIIDYDRNKKAYIDYNIFNKKTILENQKNIDYANISKYFNKVSKQLFDKQSNDIKFEVSQYIYPFESNFSNYKNVIKEIGNGWRLPTLLEFYILHLLDEMGKYYKYEIKLDDNFYLGTRNFLIENDGVIVAYDILKYNRLDSLEDIIEMYKGTTRYHYNNDKVPVSLILVRSIE